MENQNNIAQLILEQWIATLPGRNRSKTNYEANFDDLLLDFVSAGVSAALAKELLEKAIKAHLPSTVVRRTEWKRLKGRIDTDEVSFNKDWDNLIRQAAINMYFANYPIEIKKEPEKKAYNGMSAKEYKLMRQYADSFPTLDTDELEKQLHSRSLDFKIEDVLGEDNDK